MSVPMQGQSEERNGRALMALIVDDEAHARINLRLSLNALPGWGVAG
jgi:hypothetical protein